ncbi:MAG: hypothetical protein AB7I18_14875 [Candidatus Berkiella sp.]
MNVEVQAETNEGKKYSSKMNVSVTDSKPITITKKKNDTIDLIEINMPKGVAFARSPNYQIMDTHEQWHDITIQNEKIKLENDIELPIIENSALVRYKGISDSNLIGIAKGNFMFNSRNEMKK